MQPRQRGGRTRERHVDLVFGCCRALGGGVGDHDHA
jgi:hypothetical protein